jgi:hypothetical protein
MKYIVLKISEDKHWVEHFELLIKTSIGYETVTSFHPMSGDKPMIFDSKESAEKHHEVINNKNSFDALELDGKRIVYVPEQNGWIEHYEIFEKNWFNWKPIMTWHPQSGDKPKMFDSWSDAKDYIRSELRADDKKTLKFKF